jgi:hypothetical protein
MKKIALFLIASVLLLSCSDNDNNPPANYTVNFKFTQNWDGSNFKAADFGAFNFTNAHGETLSITKLRYLISRIVLQRTSGELVPIDGYNLVDVSDPTTLTFTANQQIEAGDFNKISFVYGFNQADNQDGAYPDLNAANWNWPSQLGGGYHFMQFEGKYLDNAGAQQPFAYHNGTAKVSDGVFEQNYVSFDFNTDFSINNNGDIEIKMNIAEWFKNPNLWDLNTLNVTLMPNYQAQKMMQENASTVFSIGEITTSN